MAHAPSSPCTVARLSPTRTVSVDRRPRPPLQGVPDKGKILTKISLFWFEKLKNITPTHFVTANIDDMPEEVKQYKDQLDGRAMLVKRAKVIALEAIVRGYLTGKEGRI